MTLKSKVCTYCGQTKPQKEFIKDKTRPGGLFPWCKICSTVKQKEYRRKPPPLKSSKKCPVCHGPMGEHGNRRYCSKKCKDRYKKLAEYGLTPDEFELLTKNKRCPICNKKVKRWVLDHNHKTGETTGAVCSICNQTILAYSYHDIEIAKKLVEYLKNPPATILGEKRYTGPASVSQIHRMWAWSKENGG